MARVRCLLMQRDETLLLDAWLAWHGHLFGFENLVVFDNGSTSLQIVATLRQAERAGADIRWHHRADHDFVHRGQHFHNVMREWERRGDAYDVAIPLNAEDFLACFSPTGVDCRREAIHAQLDALAGETRAFGIPATLVNVPDRPGFFRLDAAPRRFLPAHAAGAIDHGFHAMESGLADGVRDTHLTLLRFPRKPPGVTRAEARARLAPLVDVDDPAALRRHDGLYAELVPALLPADPDERFRAEDTLLLGVPGLGNLLGALRIESAFLGAPVPAWRRVPHDAVAFARPGAEPIWFDGEAYLRDNPDVAAAGWPAVFHYAWGGALEGREAAEAIFDDRAAD